MSSNPASLIEYANLNPAATADEVRALCDVAAHSGYAAVLVQPYWLRLARAHLGKESAVQVGTVIGYPLGAEIASVKGLAARLAVTDGAQLLAFVLNPAVLLNDPPASAQEIAYVVKQARLAADDAVEVTLIFESSLLSAAQVQTVVAAAQQGRPDYLQPASGFGDRQTSEQQLLALRGAGLKLKAAASSNGNALVQAGAQRLVVPVEAGSR